MSVQVCATMWMNVGARAEFCMSFSIVFCPIALRQDPSMDKKVSFAARQITKGVLGLPLPLHSQVRLAGPHGMPSFQCGC